MRSHRQDQTQQERGVLANAFHGAKLLLRSRKNAGKGRKAVNQAMRHHVRILLWDGVEYELITVINKTTFGITYEGSTGKEIADMLQDGVNRMQAKGEIVEGHVRQIYRKLVSEEFSRNAFGTFIKTLARKPKEGATLWHCSVGKDRCGTCTALLLHCLGASKEQILQDYMLTNEQTANSTQGIIARVKPHLSEKNMALLHSMLTVQQSYLDSFYDEMQQLFGGIDQFIEACGVTEQDIAALRANYLQK